MWGLSDFCFGGPMARYSIGPAVRPGMEMKRTTSAEGAALDSLLWVAPSALIVLPSSYSDLTVGPIEGRSFGPLPASFEASSPALPGKALSFWATVGRPLTAGPIEYRAFGPPQQISGRLHILRRLTPIDSQLRNPGLKYRLADADHY